MKSSMRIIVIIHLIQAQCMINIILKMPKVTNTGLHSTVYSVPAVIISINRFAVHTVLSVAQSRAKPKRSDTQFKQENNNTHLTNLTSHLQLWTRVTISMIIQKSCPPATRPKSRTSEPRPGHMRPTHMMAPHPPQTQTQTLSPPHRSPNT